MLHQVVYVSAATRPMSEGELASLLEQARNKNARLGVTGMLLYRAGEFMQVFEGERETVLDLYDTIRADERHRRVTTIVNDSIEKRSFPDWTMAFRVVDNREIAQIPGFEKCTTSRFVDLPEKDRTMAHRLLRKFGPVK